MMNGRQNFEWENTWLSGANSDHDRVLLVGEFACKLLKDRLEL